jgi:branched-chain amino acid transport system permease protein
VPIVAGVIGMIVERFLVRPLYGRGVDYPLLLTFGVGLVLLDLVRMTAGTEGMPFNTPAALSGAVDLGLFFFPKYRLFLIGITAVLLVALWLFLEKTSYGLIIRAGARDQEIVQILGVDVSKVWLVVFGTGIAIAGLAGLLAGPIRGVYPEMGVPVLVEAFVVTVVGGMGSLIGAVVAGLLLGVVVSFTAFFWPEFATLSIFVLMAIVLVVRPRGLFGRAGLMG